MAYDIFISYRRNGGYETAKHLFDLLSRDGYNVSFDIDTLRNGDFDVELLKRIEECTDFILILNKGAFDRTIDPDFDPQKDWLRQELAHALKLGKNIIPIMLNGFTEFPDNLPTDVARVQKKNGPKYDQYYFDGFYNKLVDVFLETPKPVKPTAQLTTPKPTMGTLLIDTDLDCSIFNYGKEVGLAEAGVYTTIMLPLGDNDLKYVGLECDEDCYGEIVTILENHQKLVRIKLLDKYNARKAKEEAERQRIEAERKAKEEAERKAKEEAERKAREEAERKAREEAERKAREEAKRIAQEKAKVEAARKAEQERIEAEKRAKAKAERDAYLLSLPDYSFGWFEDNGKYGFELKYDEIIFIPANYDRTHYSFSEGLVGAKLNGKWGFIDKTGKEVIPFKYDYAEEFINGLARVKLNGKYGFIDKTDKEVIPFKYDDARSFRNGLMAVKLNGKWGFIDKSGKEVISFKYDETDGIFNHGLTTVKLNGKYGYIDKSGKEITPLKYNQIDSFSEGLAVVEFKGKYGFIDKTGKEVIPLKYDWAWSFEDGKAKVKAKNIFGKETWFCIDKKGNRVDR